LLAKGLAPHQLGIWTEADWSRCLQRMGIVCALLTGGACAVLYGIGKHHQLDGQPVRISRTARLDLAFRTAKHIDSGGMRGGTTIDIFRLGRYGFQPTVRGSGYRDTLFVPLAGPAWRPGQPFELFYQCDSSCVFTVPAESSLLPENVIISGRLHRSQLPFFVKRTFERAGISLASPYYVLTDHEQPPLDIVAPAAYVGILVTAVLFGLSALYRLSPKSPSKVSKLAPKASKEDMIKTTQSPMITFALNRDSVCMADDIESHACTLSIAPSAPVLELLHEALAVCHLAGVSEMTWIVKTVGAESRTKRFIGVIAAKWREPKLLVSEHETAASLFQDGAAGLYFWYRQQSDPEADYQALKNTGRVPQREKTST